MAIRISIQTEQKDEHQSAFQLLSFINQLDMKGEISGKWDNPKPLSITIDWSDNVNSEIRDTEHLKIKANIE
jgi:hypothetical protein